MLPICPGSLLFVQSSEQSVAFGQRLFPQVLQTMNGIPGGFHNASAVMMGY